MKKLEYEKMTPDQIRAALGELEMRRRLVEIVDPDKYAGYEGYALCDVIDELEEAKRLLARAAELIEILGSCKAGCIYCEYDEKGCRFNKTGGFKWRYADRAGELAGEYNCPIQSRSGINGV